MHVCTRQKENGKENENIVKDKNSLISSRFLYFRILFKKILK